MGSKMAGAWLFPSKNRCISSKLEKKEKLCCLGGCMLMSGGYFTGLFED